MTTVLTGITTTGTPHLGNYVGAIRPAVLSSQQQDVDGFFFMADFHALIKCQNPQTVRESGLKIAATWLAAGLDVDKVTFYRQSDIPQITELCWLLTCVSAKGLLNRAHAYKAAVDANLSEQQDADKGITMGLFNYPVLMAADILMFNAHKVPVGKDQIQHLEMTRDIAARFNHLYGEHFILPEAEVGEAAVLEGLDGRKMSKSYDNTIALFDDSKKLRKQVMRIVTNSLEPGQPKDTNCAVFAICSAFASAAKRQEMQAAFAEGIGWGDAKQQLFELLEAELAPLRERYQYLMAHPQLIEDALQHGAQKARAKAAPFMAQLRDAVGISKMA